MSKLLRLVLGVAVAGVFLWLMLRHISYDGIVNVLKGASLPWVALAIVAFFAGYASRIERWRLMLAQDNPSLPWRSCAGPLMASIAANNVLPFRAGDMLRAFGFNRRLGISAATSLTTLFVERLLDLLMLLSFLGLALAYFGMDSSELVGVGAGTLLVAGALVFLLLLFPSLLKPIALGLAQIIARIMPGLGQKVLDQLHKAFAALEHTSKGNVMLRLISWSILAWIAEGAVFWCVAMSLPSISNPMAAWLALSVGTLATVIPSTPGYVGTFDYFTTQAMGALGNSATSATAYALLVHMVIWLPPSIFGALYLLVIPVDQREKLKAILP